MAIIKQTTKLTNAMDENKLAAGIFLDSVKAFDTADHSIVISKLELWDKRNCTPGV